MVAARIHVPVLPSYINSVSLLKQQKCQPVHSKPKLFKARASVETEADQYHELDIKDGVWDRESWARAYENPPEFGDGYWVTDVEGEIPKELHGTYFKVGPGQLEFLGVTVTHPLDAQGHVRSVSIKDGKAFFRSRFVKTRHSLLEEQAGKRLYEAAFGTKPKEAVSPLRQFALRNCGNTSLSLQNGKLYTYYESQLPSELDPFTLETLYPKLQDDVLSSFSLFNEVFDFVDSSFGQFLPIPSASTEYLDIKKTKLSAHPHYDASKEITVHHNYASKVDWRKSRLCMTVKIYEYDKFSKLLGEVSVDLNSFAIVHDMAFTENYFICFDSPVYADMEKLASRERGIIESLEWNESGDQYLHLIPRPSSKKRNLKHRMIKMDFTSFVFHYINAYEVGDSIVIDAIHFSKFLHYDCDDTPGKRYVDQVLKLEDPPSLAKRVVCDSNGLVDSYNISSRSVELPSINPKLYGKRYQYVYLSTALHPTKTFEHQGIGKLNVKIGTMQLWVKHKSYFCGEPIFVPKPNSKAEDDGWVVALGYDGEKRRTEFVILDAQFIENGPLAIVSLNHFVPHGIHATWTNDYYGPL